MCMLTGDHIPSGGPSMRKSCFVIVCGLVAVVSLFSVNVKAQTLNAAAPEVSPSSDILFRDFSCEVFTGIAPSWSWISHSFPLQRAQPAQSFMMRGDISLESRYTVQATLDWDDNLRLVVRDSTSGDEASRAVNLNAAFPAPLFRSQCDNGHYYVPISVSLRSSVNGHDSQVLAHCRVRLQCGR